MTRSGTGSAPTYPTSPPTSWTWWPCTRTREGAASARPSWTTASRVRSRTACRPSWRRGRPGTCRCTSTLASGWSTRPSHPAVDRPSGSCVPILRLAELHHPRLRPVAGMTQPPAVDATEHRGDAMRHLLDGAGAVVPRAGALRVDPGHVGLDMDPMIRVRDRERARLAGHPGGEATELVGPQRVFGLCRTPEGQVRVVDEPGHHTFDVAPGEGSVECQEGVPDLLLVRPLHEPSIRQDLGARLCYICRVALSPGHHEPAA